LGEGIRQRLVEEDGMTEDHDAGLVEKVARAIAASWYAGRDITARNLAMEVEAMWDAHVDEAKYAIAAVREHDAHRGEGR